MFPIPTYVYICKPVVVENRYIAPSPNQCKMSIIQCDNNNVCKLERIEFQEQAAPDLQ